MRLPLLFSSLFPSLKGQIKKKRETKGSATSKSKIDLVLRRLERKGEGRRKKKERKKKKKERRGNRQSKAENRGRKRRPLSSGA